MRPRWLLAGALAAETLPVLARMEGLSFLDHRLVTGRLAGRPVALLRCGVGPERARRRVAEALARLDAEAVLSFGTCGALVDHLDVGDVVFAEALLREDRPLAALAPPDGARRVRITTVGAPVNDARRREGLARWAEACEMEAAAVHEASGGRPMQAIKVVSDRADGALEEGPGALLRFQALALELVTRRLAPAIEAFIRG